MTFPCKGTDRQTVRTLQVCLFITENGLYLVSQFADELGVVVVCFDDVSFATGQMRGTLDEIRPQGPLSKEDLLRLQIHLSDHLVRYL